MRNENLRKRYEKSPKIAENFQSFSAAPGAVALELWTSNHCT
jgi:hypothetical protein